jgi:hypothetical protein
VVTTTDAVLTQGQIIGVLQEHAQSGDVIIAAAGGPPGDLQKVWDATGGRTCHLEFGFSCMGYEIPAAIGVRLAHPDPGARITAFLGDGTFLMAPTELVTAAQEGLPITLVIPENHGYQVIHRLQMGRSGREFGNEFRYRTTGLQLTSPESAVAAEKVGRLDGDYLSVDLVQVAAGLGARRPRPHRHRSADALNETRGHQGTVVIVVAAIPHADLPGAGVWWDVAPAEVSEIRPCHRFAPTTRPAARPSGGSGEPLGVDPTQRWCPGRRRPQRAALVGDVHRNGHPGQRRGVRGLRLRLGSARPRARRRRRGTDPRRGPRCGRLRGRHRRTRRGRGADPHRTGAGLRSRRHHAAPAQQRRRGEPPR